MSEYDIKAVAKATKERRKRRFGKKKLPAFHIKNHKDKSEIDADAIKREGAARRRK